MARVKAWLLATRHTGRDYLDTVVLFERLGPEGTSRALARLDQLYAQESGASVLAEVAERLASAAPAGLARVDLTRYRALKAPWNSWEHVASRGCAWAKLLAQLAMETSLAGALELAERRSFEKHPIQGHRGVQIIRSLVASGWAKGRT